MSCNHSLTSGIIHSIGTALITLLVFCKGRLLPRISSPGLFSISNCSKFMLCL